MDFSVLFEPANLQLYAEGVFTTLWLLLAAISAGLLLSIPAAVWRVSRQRWLAWPVAAYTYVVRGTPMLLQLYLIYYGLAQFDAVRDSAAWGALSSAGFCAALALTLNTVAYTTEMLAGALRATAPGEIEAAHSVGMSRMQMLRRIVLPSALRRSLPAYGNEVIMMLHATSLASTVTLLDLTAAADRLYANYYLPFEPFIAAALVYIALTFGLTRLFKAAERRWLAHLQARG